MSRWYSVPSLYGTSEVQLFKSQDLIQTLSIEDTYEPIPNHSPLLQKVSCAPHIRVVCAHTDSCHVQQMNILKFLFSTTQANQ
jgi:hypothetical protein